METLPNAHCKPSDSDLFEFFAVDEMLLKFSVSHEAELTRILNRNPGSILNHTFDFAHYFFQILWRVGTLSWRGRNFQIIVRAVEKKILGNIDSCY